MFWETTTDKNLRKALAFNEIAYFVKGSISIFKKCFASIDKNVFLERGLDTRLYFRKVLTLFWALMVSLDSKC